MRESPRSSALRTTPRAIRCSECASTDAAVLTTSSAATPPKVRISVTPNLPVVRVPVLSKTTAWRSLARSNALRSRIRNPDRAASAVETATTSGTARPSAWGQAMTITVAARSTANPTPSPRASHAANVAAPAERAITTSRNAARSARSWVRDRLSCAFRTRSITWAR